ncbi:hypothetical protein L3Q82_017992, partial [Scortum barcoo]
GRNEEKRDAEQLSSRGEAAHGQPSRLTSLRRHKGKSTYRSDAVIDKPTGGLHSRFAISAGRSGSTSFTGYYCCCASSAASGAIFLACLLRSGPPGLTTEVFRRESDVSLAREASSALLKIRQGRWRVVDYALEFRTLAADSGWNETSIISGAFMDGLAEEVKDFLAPLDTPRDFESLVEIASHASTIASVRGERESVGRVASLRGSRRAPHSFREFRRSSHLSTPVPESPSPPAAAGAEEPMQLGRTKLAPEERQRRLKEGACFYCGKSGHQVNCCPAKEKAHQG